MIDPTQEQGPRSLAQERRRLAFLTRVAASAGEFSRKLGDAIEAATDPEVRILSDLVERGMSVPALVSFLQGAHIIVGDEELYQRWMFPNSHERLSSHHKDIDKSATPDYGLEGPLVVEALYGRVTLGTWVQLERTATDFRWGQRITWQDMGHIRDFFIYRITGKNVGPWGLSGAVDTRPMVLRPRGETAAQGAQSGLVALASRRAGPHGTSQERASWASALSPHVSPIGPAGDLFAAPEADSAEQLLPERDVSTALGLGLFGGLAIMRASAKLAESVAATLDTPSPTVGPAPLQGTAVPVEVAIGSGTLCLGAGSVPTSVPTSTFFGLQEEPA